LLFLDCGFLDTPPEELAVHLIVMFLNDMNREKPKKLVLVAGASLAFVVALLWAVSFSLRVSSGEYAFTKTFEKITPGFDEEKVLALLGKPDEKGNEFRLGQYDGFEKAYQRASKSNTKNYWFWYRGQDIVYAVGFDDQRKVVVAEHGGT
jgi:hypothetical protein